MINWVNLGANALWILGCAMALAALSYASWESSIYKEKFSNRLKRPEIQAALCLGGFLFTAGLAATSGSILETTLWTILAAAFLIQGWILWIRRRQRAG